MPRASANGIELEYESFGEGEPIVLVMGVGVQMLLWPEEFCAALVERGFRVIRFDNRDVGLSTKFHGHGLPNPLKVWQHRLLGAAPAAPYTLHDMADDIAGLLDALALPSAHLVGVSLGGMIAQTFAIRHPSRLRSLTSIMSTPGCVRHMVAYPGALRALMGLRPRSEEAYGEWLVNVFRVLGAGGFPLDEARFRALGRASYLRSRDDDRGAVRQLAAMVASGSRRAALSAVRVPTTVIHGGRDPLILPAAGRATAQAIAGARFRLIERMGHEMPREVWPLLLDEIEQLAQKAAPLDHTHSLHVRRSAQAARD
jgi:pimeloyl-ACP methyl ester carboxylesterase